MSSTVATGLLCVTALFWAKMTFLQSRGRVNTSYLSPPLSIALALCLDLSFSLILLAIFWHCVYARRLDGAARLNTCAHTNAHTLKGTWPDRHVGVNISCVASQRCVLEGFFFNMNYNKSSGQCLDSRLNTLWVFFSFSFCVCARVQAYHFVFRRLKHIQHRALLQGTTCRQHLPCVQQKKKPRKEAPEVLEQRFSDHPSLYAA